MIDLLKLGLIFTAILIVNVKCDANFMLNCQNEEDCKTFANNDVRAICIGDMCECIYRQNKSSAACTPRDDDKDANNNVEEPISLGITSPFSICPCQALHKRCYRGRCVCFKGFIESRDGRTCISEKIQLGKSCENGMQCKRFDKNAICIEKLSVCQCKEGFHALNGTCRSVSRISGIKNQQCLDDGTCVCNENFIYEPKKSECLPYLKYEETCISHAQCFQGNGNGTRCINDKCLCDESHTHVVIEGNDICELNVKHSDKCNRNLDCSGYFDDPRMICENKTCICNEDYNLNESGTCIYNPDITSEQLSFLGLATCTISGLLLIILVGIGFWNFFCKNTIMVPD